MNQYPADRGAHGQVKFIRCARGFLLTTGDEYSGSFGTLYAFDRIEDVATWFIEQYRDPPAPEQGPVSEGIAA